MAILPDIVEERPELEVAPVLEASEAELLGHRQRQLDDALAVLAGVSVVEPRRHRPGRAPCPCRRCPARAGSPGAGDVRGRRSPGSPSSGTSESGARAARCISSATTSPGAASAASIPYTQLSRICEASVALALDHQANGQDEEVDARTGPIGRAQESRARRGRARLRPRRRPGRVRRRTRRWRGCAGA